MQSSIWKLLTAAGVIGIGTFVALEVRSRVIQSQKWSQAAETATAGVETLVTPDAQSEFDRMVQTELNAPGPEDFDKPGAGAGTPAPPAGDEKFVGVVDQKVNKEDLTDGGNPFSMDEPELSEPATNEFPTATTAGFDSETKNAASPAVQPVAFHPEEATQPTAKKESVPTTADNAIVPGSVAAVDSATLAPTPKSVPPKPPNAKTDASGKYQFFGSKSGSTPDSRPTVPSTAEPTPENKAMSSTEKKSAETTRGESPQIPIKEAATPTPAVAKAPTSPSDEPMLTFPAPVPDVTQPASHSGLGTSDEVLPFDADTPKPIERNPPAATLSRPASPDSDVPDFSPFDPDTDRTPERPATNTGIVPPSTPGSRTPTTDEPFPIDPDDKPVPITDNPRTAPRRDPVGTEPFPEPSFPDRTSRPFDDSEPLNGTGARSGRDRSRSDSGGSSSNPRDPAARSDEPFEMDEPSRDEPSIDEPPFDSGSGVQPLPSADDLPLPNDRPRSRPDSGRSGSRTVSASHTEVLRPQLTIQKIAPNTATVGVPHKYTIVVANEGQSPAYDVVVEDQLGSEATLVDSRPVAEYDRRAEKLSWKIPELGANQKREIVVTIKPSGEGTLDGVATVGFKAQVKSETVITSPKLELDVTGPEDAKVGSEIPLQFVIRNRGTSDASNVILRSVLPPALQHPEGADLEYEIDTLRAGDEEVVDLAVVAAEPGDRVLVSAEITSNGASLAKGRTEIEVVGVQLSLERRGPERRFVGRPALYQNVVTNESRFEALNATVVEEIPEGSRFVSASNGGAYNAQNRRVTWSIPRLPAGKQLALEIELVTEEAGEVESIVEVTEDAGFRTPLAQNTKVTVEDLHNVTADISRQDEPVAIGEQFGFTVTIENRGTAVARNVMMSIQVPLEIRVLAAGTKQVKGSLDAGRNLVTYDTVQEIQPNDKVTFQIKLQGQKPIRNAAVKASLTYDEMPEPLVVSESVTVFDDRP